MTTLPAAETPEHRPTAAHTYDARVLRVIDGDTLDVEVDLGFRLTTRLPLRIARIDAPERNTPEGKAATKSVTEFLGPLPAAVTVRTMKPVDKYGRYLADVFTGEGAEGGDVARWLLDGGHATPYTGSGA